MAVVNPYRLKISQFRALVAIADQGSFSEAAFHLGLSQSAVSHAIATLEAELGVVLLHRGRQGAVLTPVGKTVTTEAHRVLQALNQVATTAQQFRGLGRGQVRIAGFRSVATHILPAVIAGFRRQYPEIEVSIDECDHFHNIEAAVQQGQADIGFTYLPTGAKFDAWELMRDRYLVLLPPGSDPNQAATWEQLNAYPLILAPVNDCCRDLISAHARRFGVDLRPAYEVREDSTILGMVRRDLGGTIMAQLAAEPLPSDLVVAELPVPLERIIGVINLADALHPPPVYAFLETLKQVMAAIAPLSQPVCHHGHPSLLSR